MPWALHYMARHFFEPVLLSGLEDPVSGTVSVHLTNDLPTEVTGTVRWSVTDARGRRLADGTRRAAARPLADTVVETIRLKKHMEAQGPRDLIVWLEFTGAEGQRSRNMVLFGRPKHLQLAPARVSAGIKARKDGAFDVSLSSKAPALWTWLELEGMDGTFSDNFIHVCPGHAESIRVVPKRTLTMAQFRKALRVRSLFDTSTAR